MVIPFCTELDLRANKIANISVKGSLNKVETLHLDGNLLNDLRPGMFTGFSSCKNLYLQNSRISQIHAGAF